MDNHDALALVREICRQVPEMHGQPEAAGPAASPGPCAPGGRARPPGPNGLTGATPERRGSEADARACETEPGLVDTLAYLASPGARASLEADAYWPKWDTPWWRLCLLMEMGLPHAAPPGIHEALLAASRAQYLDFFPLRIEDVPPGKDPRRDVACHCALGTLYRMLDLAGLDVDRELPWARGWFLQYQMADGGLNCDEEAYTRPSPHSSIVSTLPPAEAILLHTHRAFRPDEVAFLDRVASYLIERCLAWSRSKGNALMAAEFVQLRFPRFYTYDVLRGLSFLARWALALGRDLPARAIAQAVQIVGEHAPSPSGDLLPRIWACDGTRTIAQDSTGAWSVKRPASTFPLLDEVSRPGSPSPHLTREWRATAAALRRIDAGGRLV